MGLKERLVEFIDYLNISKSAFERKCNLSNGFVDSSSDKTRDSSIQMITNKYPELNTLWLRTGYGEMLLSPNVSRQLKEVHEMYAEEIKACKEEEKIIEASSFVHLLPINAIGGTLNDFVMSIKESDYERIISPIKGVDFAITVSGDSMSPEYTSGSHVFVKKINEKVFIDWGKTYVIDTCNGTVIKKLMPGADKNKIRCVSINPEYPPFEVRFEDIYSMYRVMMCMTIK